jgi:hypothetical protein
MPDKNRRNAKTKVIRGNTHIITNPYMKKTLQNIELIYGNIMDDFKNMGIFKQSMICFIILLFIFITIIVYYKIKNITVMMSNQSNINYYTKIVIELLNIEKDFKMDLDIINNNDYMCLFYTHIYFYKIYSKELNSHDYMTMFYDVNNPSPEVDVTYQLQSLNSDASLNSIFTNLNKIEDNNLDFSLRHSFNNLDYPNEKNHKNMDLDYFVPIMYTFSPLFYQNLKHNKINLLNYYFLGYSYNDGCDNTKNNVFFKYPLEESETSPTMLNKNFFDSTVDPIGKCFLLSGVRQTEIPKVVRTNWYNNYENKFLLDQTRKSDTRLFTLLKLGLNFDRNEYSINYVSTKINSPSGKINIFTFAQKIDKSNSELPFSSIDKSIEKPYDYFSMINFPNPFEKNYTYNYVNVDPGSTDDIFLHKYNIDDNSTLVTNVPNFIQNIYKYTMLPNSIVFNNSRINSNSLMLSYTEMARVWEDYSTNYYYEVDTNVLDFISFINNFLLYRQYEKRIIQEKNMNSSDTNSINSLMTKSFHKCLNSNLTEWYNYVKDRDLKTSYDCLNDYCFFNNCTADDPLYKKPSDMRFLPNCYCFPMYCTDPFTFRDKYSIPQEFINLNSSNFYEDFNNYYDDAKGVVKCRLSFYQKHQNITPYNYRTSAMLKNTNIRYNTSIFILYLNEEMSTNETVMKFITSNTDKLQIIVYLVNLIILIFLCICFIKCFGTKLNILVNRFEKFKYIIKMILKISENEEYDGDAIYNTQDCTEENYENRDDSKILNSLSNEKSEIINSNINEEDEEVLNHDADFVTKVKNYENKIESPTHSEESYNSNSDNEHHNSDYSSKNESDGNSNNNNLVSRVYEELKILGIGREEESENKGEHHDRYSDELQQLIFIIVDNLSEFKIEFDVNTNIYASENSLNKQYVELIKSKFYQERILPLSYNLETNRTETVNNNILLSDNLINQSPTYEDRTVENENYIDTQSSLEDLSENISLNLIYELLSTDEMIEFSSMRSNFYFKGLIDKENILIDFYKPINDILFDDSNSTNELTEPEKCKAAIEYYSYEIHKKWVDLYEKFVKNNKI